MTGEQPKTRAQLAGEVSGLTAALQQREAVIDKLQREFAAKEKEGRTQLDDLKQRLAIAEAENQRMRGYISRVQEDDVVREELVTVGDPAGEQHAAAETAKVFKFSQVTDVLAKGMQVDPKVVLNFDANKATREAMIGAGGADKPTPFFEPNSHSDIGAGVMGHTDQWIDRHHQRKPRHWVTY